ncbi:hypothetical protein BBJ28_00004069 [Nothophytophthora sp. Chile5]|nr:hypothetical protein BBJ28_00004069 [Nothophytophthora sp. Chile5]
MIERATNNGTEETKAAPTEAVALKTDSPIPSEASMETAASRDLKVNVALLPKPSDGLSAPHVGSDSTSPVSPTVMKDLPFDARFISDAWSYEAPQNMYAMLTHQLEPLATSNGLVTPLMQLQAQQQLQLQQQQQLEQQLDAQQHALALQMSPIHGSGLSSLYMPGPPLVVSPHQLLLPPQHPAGMTSGFPTTGSTVNLGDVMLTGEAGLFLAPSASPTNLLKHLLPPIAAGGHPGAGLNVKDLTLNELRPHFNKPMAVVAKELGVCITLMKKICRRNGLVRWPHRRIRSLVNRITSLQVLAGNATGAERKRFQAQIAGLREELSAVIQNPNEKSRKAQADAKARSPVPPTLEASEDKGSFAFALDEMKTDDQENVVNDESNGKAPRRKKKQFRDNHMVQMAEPVLPVETKQLEASKQDEKPGKSSSRSKKRKQSPQFGHHAHPPPPIKIPRRDELPSLNRLRSQSVPERRLRGDRRHGRGRDNSSAAACDRPSTTTHRNGRRGSISSILCDIAE